MQARMLRIFRVQVAFAQVTKEVRSWLICPRCGGEEGALVVPVSSDACFARRCLPFGFVAVRSTCASLVIARGCGRDLVVVAQTCPSMECGRVILHLRT